MFGGKLGLPEVVMILIIALTVPVLTVVAWWKIFSKSGHPGILSLVMLIPAVNLFLLLWFGFSDWPIEKKLRTGGQG